VRRFAYENGLTLFFGAIFIAALVAQSLTGWDAFNEEQVRHGAAELSFVRYITSSEFGAAVMENWQSEYLQFTLYLLMTVWLLQKGSPESKELGKEGLESDQQQLVGEHAGRKSPKWARVGGLRTAIYSNSLLIAMGTIWIGSWLAQSITARAAYNEELLSHQQDALSWTAYLGTSDFWERTLQNWQSEFLAVGSMAIVAVYLRQRGSPESKPVGAAHHTTGVEG
jgi:uncharacterized protein DUF6766